MRADRVASVGLLTVFLVPLLAVGPVWADPDGYYAEPVEWCSVDNGDVADPPIDEISGLVALSDEEILVVQDSPEPDPVRNATMYRMDRTDGDGCVESGLAEFAAGAADIEDIALLKGTHWDPDTVWFADIGDNGQVREQVALITAPYPSGQPEEPKVFRLTYPDGPHDAEALLLPPNGTPYIVTKEVDGTAGVYRPGAPLDAFGVVEMDLVGEVEFEPTGTPGGPVGRVGQTMVTGGAVSADGRFLALRTYTDAYVWPLAGNDVPTALDSEPIAVVAIPGSPQGEAISFAGELLSDDPCQEERYALVVGSEGVRSDVDLILAAGIQNAPPGIVGPFQPGEDVSTTSSLDLLAGEDQAGEDQSGRDQLSGWQTIAYAILVGAVGWLFWWLYGLTRRKQGTGAQGG